MTCKVTFYSDDDHDHDGCDGDGLNGENQCYHQGGQTLNDGD